MFLHQVRWICNFSVLLTLSVFFVSKILGAEESLFKWSIKYEFLFFMYFRRSRQRPFEIYKISFLFPG